jgi:hypothetical protein
MFSLRLVAFALLSASTVACVVGELPTTTGPDVTGSGSDTTGGGSGSDTGSDTGSGTGSNTAPALTASQYLEGASKKECDEAFSCKDTYPLDGLTTFEQEYGATAQDCYTLQLNKYAPTIVEAEIAANKLSFNPVLAASCLSTPPADCATYWTMGPSACRDVFHGSVADGEACVIDLECVNQDSFCLQGVNICVPGLGDPGEP